MNRSQKRLERRKNRKPRSVRRAEALAHKQRKQFLKRVVQEVPALITFIVLLLLNVYLFSIESNAHDNEPIIKEEITEEFVTVDRGNYSLGAQLPLPKHRKMSLTISEDAVSANDSISNNAVDYDSISDNTIVEEDDEEYEPADEEEIKMLSIVICSEMGCFFQDESLTHAEAVEAAFLTGGVVCNRMRIKNLSMKEIIFAPGQYGDATKANVRAGKMDTDKWSPEICIIAQALLEGRVKKVSKELAGESIDPIPENLYYQLQAPTGSGVYKHIGNQYYSFM